MSQHSDTASRMQQLQKEIDFLKKRTKTDEELWKAKEALWAKEKARMEERVEEQVEERMKERMEPENRVPDLVRQIQELTNANNLLSEQLRKQNTTLEGYKAWSAKVEKLAAEKHRYVTLESGLLIEPSQGVNHHVPQPKHQPRQTMKQMPRL